MFNNLGEWTIKTAIVVVLLYLATVVLFVTLGYYTRKKAKSRRVDDKAPTTDNLMTEGAEHTRTRGGYHVITAKCDPKLHEVQGACAWCCNLCDLGVHACLRCGARLRHDGLGLRGETHTCVAPAAPSA